MVNRNQKWANKELYFKSVVTIERIHSINCDFYVLSQLLQSTLLSAIQKCKNTILLHASFSLCLKLLKFIHTFQFSKPPVALDDKKIMFLIYAYTALKMKITNQTKLKYNMCTNVYYTKYNVSTDTI